jgi:hypothetical protein
VTHPPGSPEERLQAAVQDSAGAWAGRRFVVAAAVIALMAGLVAAGVAYQVSTANESRVAAQQQAAAVGQQAQNFADLVKAACAKDIVAATEQGFPCVQASSIAASPAPGQTGSTGPTGAPGDRGPGPTQAEITTAVLDYLTVHPPAPGTPGAAGQNASAEQVAGAVSAYLLAHPAVTADDLAAAVGAYLRANPPPAGTNGKDGSNGKDGTPGTAGQSGTNGAAGVGVSNVQVTNCELVVTLTDSRVIDAGSMCTPPPSTPPPPTTTTAPPPTSSTAPPIVPLPTR